MTTVGLQLPVSMHTTLRKPRERKIDFDHLDLKKVQDLVGRPAIGVADRGKWVEVDFGNCTVSFRKWKSI